MDPNSETYKKVDMLLRRNPSLLDNLTFEFRVCSPMDPMQSDGRASPGSKPVRKSQSFRSDSARTTKPMLRRRLSASALPHSSPNPALTGHPGLCGISVPTGDDPRSRAKSAPVPAGTQTDWPKNRMYSSEFQSKMQSFYSSCTYGDVSRQYPMVKLSAPSPECCAEDMDKRYSKLETAISAVTGTAKKIHRNFVLVSTRVQLHRRPEEYGSRTCTPRPGSQQGHHRKSSTMSLP